MVLPLASRGANQATGRRSPWRSTVCVVMKIERGGKEMKVKRIQVPESHTLQVYTRDSHGNKILFDLRGPLDVSVVPIELEDQRGGTKNGKV